MDETPSLKEFSPRDAASNRVSHLDTHGRRSAHQQGAAVTLDPTPSARSGPGAPAGPSVDAAGGVDPSRPHPARVYDCLLGGKDHYAADRLVASRLVEVAPLVVSGVRANRAFLRRAVRFLVGRGITQFVDLGCGLPTHPNVHEIVGRVDPEARCVYVDIDPVVLVHARALLADDDRTIVVDGDIREPDKILADPGLRVHLDPARPVAVVMAAVLHLVREEEDPDRIVRSFAEVMVPGSALAISHVVIDDGADAVGAATRRGAALYTETTAPFVPRTREQVAAWFEGFTLVPPGLVHADAWRRSGPATTNALSAPVLAGVGIRDKSPHGG